MGQIRDRRIAERRPSAQSRAAAPRFAPAGQSTQMIVGATPTTDARHPRHRLALYRRYALRRVYYSAFSPIPQAPTRRCRRQPPPLVREHRLYQADWLMRFYGFDAGELTTAGSRTSTCRSIRSWRGRCAIRESFPVDSTRAPREALLRVPGLGVPQRRADPADRRHHRLTLATSRSCGVSLTKARPFVVAADSTRRRRLLDRAELEGTRASAATADTLRRRGSARHRRAVIRVRSRRHFRHWQRAARRLLAGHVDPRTSSGCRTTQPATCSTASPTMSTARRRGPQRFLVPRRFVALAQRRPSSRRRRAGRCSTACSGDCTHGNRDLLEIAVDHDVRALRAMVRQVNRDEHKMHAFVRFRRVEDGRTASASSRGTAPDHLDRRLAAPFFADRFRGDALVDPDAGPLGHWDGERLTFTPGVPRSAAPTEDELEDLWRDLLRRRLQSGPRQPRGDAREMPVRHWATLPEPPRCRRCSPPRRHACSDDARRERRWRQCPAVRAGRRIARRAAGARPRAATAARSTSPRRRPCSARDRDRRASCWSANSRATRRTRRARRSSARPARCSNRALADGGHRRAAAST